MKSQFLVCKLAILLGMMGVSAQLSKGGGGISRFRESIASIQRQQEQPLSSLILKKNEEQTFSKSQIYQKPSIVVENVRQEFEDTQTESGPTIYGQVEGQPGVDFPGYTSIPNTKFSCEGLPFDGMYADEATGCQVYHLCYQGRRESFLCGIGTVFNQAILSCDFWHSVDCSKSSQYYHLNADFGKGSPEPSAIQKSIDSQYIKSVTVNQVSKPREEGKTSFFKEQRFSSSVVSAKPTVDIIDSRLKTTSGIYSVNQPIGGKTNVRESTLRAGNFLSPSMRLQVQQTSVLADRNGGQYALESSNYMNVTTNSKTSVNSTTFGGSRRTSPLYKTNPNVGKSNTKQDSATSNELVKPPVDNSPWKPYFKKKPTTVEPTSTTGATSTAQPIAAQPDKEPSFSNTSEGNEESLTTRQPQVPKSGPPSLTSYETTTLSPQSLAEVGTKPTDSANSTTSQYVDHRHEEYIESPITTATSNLPSPGPTTTSPFVSETTRDTESTQPSQPDTTTTSPTTSPPDIETTEAQPVVRSIIESSVEYAKP